MIDSHMHINKMLLSDCDYYINRVLENNNIEKVINVALNVSTSIELLHYNKFNKFVSSVGIHPLYINGQNINILEELIDDKVVAIGEIGLDILNNNIELQKEYFINQIAIANNNHLPVIIHANGTNQLVLDILAKYPPLYGCVFHCFKPNIDCLEEIIKRGYYISFAGKILAHNAKKSLEVAKIIPNELFLVETDSPYMVPDIIDAELNESSNLKYIVHKLAELRSVSCEEIDKVTTENTKRLFKKL